jgi:predicted Zn-dependent protease
MNYLIEKYLKAYKKNPQSRIFAPLAEAYRKANHLPLALQIAQEGLLHHPDFMGGKVALSRIYFDMREYEKVIQILSPVCDKAPDNFVAQKLLSEAYLLTGNSPAALQAFKIMLFFYPQNTELEGLIRELEAQIFQDPEALFLPENKDPLFQKSKKAEKVKKLTQFLQKLEKHHAHV